MCRKLTNRILKNLLTETIDRVYNLTLDSLTWVNKFSAFSSDVGICLTPIKCHNEFNVNFPN